MLTSLGVLQQLEVKTFEKLTKKAYIDEEIPVFLNDLLYFNEMFRKTATYDNVKNHLKSELQPISRKQNFGKTTPSIFRVKNIC